MYSYLLGMSSFEGWNKKQQIDKKTENNKTLQESYFLLEEHVQLHLPQGSLNATDFGEGIK